MRTALAFVALFFCSIAYADPCTCQKGNPCLCVFGCECKVDKPKPPDPVKPPPISVNVPPACCCAVGDACGCAPGHCHCASAQWFETPGTGGNEYGLFKGSKQVGSYRRSDGVFLPLLGDSWGQPCKCPKTPPGRGSGATAQPQTYMPAYVPAWRSDYSPDYIQPRMWPQTPRGTGGRSGGC